jgi:hypothetical protein
MNFAPKVGPVVAELLSGIAALLIMYLAIQGPTFSWIDSLSSGAIAVLVLIAWILGTFFDLIRNHLEWIWDSKHFTPEELNWSFFFRGDAARLANLEHYFWSFYMLDADMAIAILLSVSSSPLIALRLRRVPIPGYMCFIWLLLLLAALLFANDARRLRYEIKALLHAESR